jgi:hypothetical protein
MNTYSIEKYAEMLLEKHEDFRIELEPLIRPDWWRAHIRGGNLNGQFGDGESASDAIEAVEDIIRDYLS